MITVAQTLAFSLMHAATTIVGSKCVVNVARADALKEA